MNLDPILKLKANNLDSLSPQQESLLSTLREQLISYNKDEIERLEWSNDKHITTLVSAYSDKRMWEKVFPNT